MTMSFVNFRGEPLAVAAPGPAKKTTKQQPDSYHKGWLVVGYSPTQISAARAEHEKAEPGKPFDEAGWMRKTKPVKARSRPYEIHDAAEQCAELMRRAGWKVVQVVAKAKGDQ